MKCGYACGSQDHSMARRKFLSLSATGAIGVVGGLGFLTRGQAAEQVQQKQKRVVVFNMHGGLSQLEIGIPNQVRKQEVLSARSRLR